VKEADAESILPRGEAAAEGLAGLTQGAGRGRDAPGVDHGDEQREAVEISRRVAQVHRRSSRDACDQMMPQLPHL
jgi:hypothetical protein